MPAVWEKNRVGTVTHTAHQGKFQLDQRFKCKTKQENIKIPEESMGKLLYKLGEGQAFLTMTPNPEAIK